MVEYDELFGGVVERKRLGRRGVGGGKQGLEQSLLEHLFAVGVVEFCLARVHFGDAELRFLGHALH